MMLVMSSRVQLLDFDNLAEGALAQCRQDLVWGKWQTLNFNIFNHLCRNHPSQDHIWEKCQLLKVAPRHKHNRPVE